MLLISPHSVPLARSFIHSHSNHQHVLSIIPGPNKGALALHLHQDISLYSLIFPNYGKDPQHSQGQGPGRIEQSRSIRMTPCPVCSPPPPMIRLKGIPMLPEPDLLVRAPFSKPRVSLSRPTSWRLISAGTTTPTHRTRKTAPTLGTFCISESQRAIFKMTFDACGDMCWAQTRTEDRGRGCAVECHSRGAWSPTVRIVTDISTRKCCLTVGGSFATSTARVGRSRRRSVVSARSRSHTAQADMDKWRDECAAIRASGTCSLPPACKYEYR